MAINKVEYGDEVLIDLTSDTVTSETLLEGETAHDSSGNEIIGTYNSLNTSLNSLVNVIYPIGSIYMSVNDVSPSTLFEGTTWEQIKDKFLLSSGDKYLAGATGGSSDAVVPYHTHTFTGSAVTSGGSSATNTGSESSHTHSVGAHAHELNSHTHSVGAHAHGLNSHTHSVGAHSHGLNSHTHSFSSAHTHGLNSHTHSIPALSGTAASNGSHSHTLKGSTIKWVPNTGEITASSSCYFERVTSGTTAESTNSNGAHTHSVTTTASTTGGNSGNTASGTASGTTGAASGSTANSTAFNSGAASGSTANSTAFNTGASSGNTANSTAFNSGAGSSHSHTMTHTHSVTASGSNSYAGTSGNANGANMPPYLAVYVWKRTA